MDQMMRHWTFKTYQSTSGRASALVIYLYLMHAR